MKQADTLLARKRRRVLYRAAHRGTKEMDWLLGRFAKEAVPTMDDGTLERFEALLALPDPEIELWLKGGAEKPRGGIEDIIDALRRFHGLG